jgi:hypothetical protein
MARQGALKRQKERTRLEKQRAKGELRVERNKNKEPRSEAGPGEDPDIAGIVAGPQPPIEGA